jgi:hypothetical protein
MKTYSVSFSYSRDGKSYTQRNTFVKATSSADAISQIKSKFPNAKDIRITNIR